VRIFKSDIALQISDPDGVIIHLFYSLYVIISMSLLKTLQKILFIWTGLNSFTSITTD